MVKHIAGAILSGGKATRLFGINKGELRLSVQQTILDKLIAEFNTVNIVDIFISVNQQNHYLKYGKPMIADNFLDIGPLGGIEAILRHNQDNYEATIFMPCDLPNISSKEILKLITAFDKTQAPIVYARTTEHDSHPLCVVMRNHLVPKLIMAIENGVRKPSKLWQQLNGEAVLFEDESRFLNINSMGDLIKAGLAYG